MLSRADSRRIILTRFTLLLIALLCAGCNLNTSQVSAPARFDGPPIIHIAAPLPNQTFLAGTTVIVQARVENAGPDLVRIAVLLDDALLGERLNPNETSAAVLPLTIDWPTSNSGQYKISVKAERGDGTSAREDVSILVIPDEPAEPMEESAETTIDEPEPTRQSEPVAEEATAQPQIDEAQPAATVPPQTEPPVVTGESRIAGIVIQPSNLRLGPSTAHDLVGSLPKDQEVVIVAVSPARDWYRITYSDLGDAWIYSELVSPSADISGVPVETGPQAPSQDGVNLVLEDLQLADAITCNQPFSVVARISNRGTVAPLTGAWVVAEAILDNSGESLTGQAPPQHNLRILQPGEEESLTFELTLTLHYEEDQMMRVTVDSGNHIAETDEQDNIGARPFRLARGDCG